MDQEGVVHCLWSSSDNLQLWIEEEPQKSCVFYVVRGETSEVVLEWQHKSKRVARVCCVCTSENQTNGGQTHLLKVAWAGVRTVYCDYVTISGTESVVESEPLIDVNFDISAFYLIWNHGIALVLEKTLESLHVFDTGRGSYQGFVSLYSGATHAAQLEHLIKYDSSRKMLWTIVNEYNEPTRVSCACLNAYRVPTFTLESSIRLPRGFTDYAFVKAPGIQHLEQFEDISTVVCSSCDLLGKSILQWFLDPKFPWREHPQDYPAILKPAQAVQKPMKSNYEPQLPLPEIDKPPRSQL